MVEVCMRGIDTGFVTLGYAKVVALGVLQGITELLPVSSTAHMRLVPYFLGWQDPGSAFSAAMQLAAVAAVVSYFWTDVRDLAANSIRAVARGQFRDRDFRFALWIGVATVPIALAGLKEVWELYNLNLDLAGWSILFVGLIVASISAFFAIWGLMRVLQNFSTWPFAVYRFVLGVAILVGVAMGWLI